MYRKWLKWELQAPLNSPAGAVLLLPQRWCQRGPSGDPLSRSAPLTSQCPTGSSHWLQREEPFCDWPEWRGAVPASRLERAGTGAGGSPLSSAPGRSLRFCPAEDGIYLGIRCFPSVFPRGPPGAVESRQVCAGSASGTCPVPALPWACKGIRFHHVSFRTWELCWCF